MTRMILAALPLLAAVPLLAACATDGATTPPPADAEAAVPGTRCDANAAQGLLARAGAEIEAEAKRLSGAATVRRYGPGAMLTKDYRIDRLNIEEDAGGKVVKITCG